MLAQTFLQAFENTLMLATTDIYIYIYVVEAYSACASDVNVRPSIEPSRGWQGTAEYANVDAEADMLVA